MKKIKIITLTALVALLLLAILLITVITGVNNHNDGTSVPRKILRGNTEDLFDYFCESEFLLNEIMHGMLFSSIEQYNKYADSSDFTVHEAFRELITRDDFMTVLEIYAKDTLTSSNPEDFAAAKLERILRQKSVKDKFSLLQNTSTDYPYISSYYSKLLLISTS